MDANLKSLTHISTEANCIVPENISLTATPFATTLSWVL